MQKYRQLVEDNVFNDRPADSERFYAALLGDVDRRALADGLSNSSAPCSGHGTEDLVNLIDGEPPCVCDEHWATANCRSAFSPPARQPVRQFSRHFSQ